MLTYKIHLIRHGMTQGNMEKRFIGITDIPLCEQGRIQLFEKQKKYKQYRPYLLFRESKYNLYYLYFSVGMPECGYFFLA